MKRFWQLLGLLASGALMFVFQMPEVRVGTYEYAAYFAFAICFLLAAAVKSFSASDPEKDDRFYLEFTFAILKGLGSSFIVFLGGTAALLAWDSLIGFKLEFLTHTRIFLFCAVILGPVTFMGGVCRYLILPSSQSVPLSKFFFKFLLFVVIPLLGLHMTIVYVYVGKILYFQDWPKGYVAWLISCFSALGIFVHFVVTPYKDTQNSDQISKILKWFYLGLLPLLVVLAMAWYVRFDSYGMTEQRYSLLLLTIWFGLAGMYFLFARKRAKEWSVLSLLFLTGVLCWGPFSMRRVTLHSQQQKLEKKFQDFGLWENGIYHPPRTPDALTKDQRVSLEDSITYLWNHHGVEAFSPWISSQALAILRGGFDAHTNGEFAGLSLFVFFRPSTPVLDALKLPHSRDSAVVEAKPYYYSAQLMNEVYSLGHGNFLLRFDVRKEWVTINSSDHQFKVKVHKNGILIQEPTVLKSELYIDLEPVVQGFSVQALGGQRIQQKKDARLKQSFAGGSLELFVSRVTGNLSVPEVQACTGMAVFRLTPQR